MRRLLGFLVVVIFIAAGAPARADVGITAGTSGLGLQAAGRYRVQIEHFLDGSRNGFRIRQLGFGDPRIFTSASACQENAVFNDVVCNLVSPQVITMSPEDQAQEILVGGSAQACEPATQETLVQVDTRGGDDIVRGTFQCGSSSSSSDIRSSPRFTGTLGAGNDTFSGGRRDDQIRGGTGNDSLSGDSGADTLRGEDGDDTLEGGVSNDTLIGGHGEDVIRGGGGTDVVRYENTGTLILRISLDGVANDGPLNEHDNVDVETVLGADGWDVLTGSSRDETFDGGPGNDSITPGLGTDTARGGTGDDVIDVREAIDVSRDTVTCGTGDDAVIADLVDDVLGRTLISSPKDDACERIERFAVDDGPPARIPARTTRVPRDGAVRIRLTCPAGARVTCRGVLRLVDNRRLGRTLTSARYSIPRRRSGTVRLRLTRAQARVARRRGSITAITRERGVSEKGPRSTQVTFDVR
jgi:hypothetical protein